jgi:glycosyltransferase involved in cell wall biosynthesis
VHGDDDTDQAPRCLVSGGRSTLWAVSTEPFRKLSIFFPMWNEEDYVERTIDRAHEQCQRMIGEGAIVDYELIIVDDASTDRTAELADKLAAIDERVKVVHHPVNRKLGGAIKTGFAAATGDLVLYTDADLPFDLEEAAKAVRLMAYYEADVVSAFRFDRTGEGSLRALYTLVYNALIRWWFGVRMRDINFAFKLCRTRIFEHINLHSEGSFIDAELIIRAKKLGYSVIQFGVDYFPRTRGVSTLASLGVIRTIVREMWALRNDLRNITAIHQIR